MHQKGFSPMCILGCLPRPRFHRGVLSQKLHYKGFSAICILRCLPRPPFHRGALSQRLHQKGFSPVCILRCLPRPPFHSEALPQKSIRKVYHQCASSGVYQEHPSTKENYQKNEYERFSPMCILRCLPRPPFHKGALLQTQHQNFFLQCALSGVY